MGKRKKKEEEEEENWIKNAIKRPGSLRRWVLKHYGKRGLTSRGTIKVELLRRLAERSDRIGKKARLALTLRKLRK
jgi:hypothetical protein